MGIAERKKREKIELKEKIIAAATELFLEQGFERASIRMIADKIEYSPATIYLHFKDKNELFATVSERAFALFFEYFSAVNSIEDPMHRLKELGKQYLKFASDHPAYYDLMFVNRAPMEHEDQQWSGERSHDILINTVQECMDQGHFKGHELHPLSLAIWSAVHGLASLKLRKRLSMYEGENVDLLLEKALGSLNGMLDPK